MQSTLPLPTTTEIPQSVICPAAAAPASSGPDMSLLPSDQELAELGLTPAFMADLEQMLASGVDFSQGIDPFADLLNTSVTSTGTFEDGLSVMPSVDGSSPVSSASESSLLVTSPAAALAGFAPMTLDSLGLPDQVDISGLAAMTDLSAGQLTFDAVSQWAMNATGPFAQSAAATSISPAMLQFSPFVADQLPVFTPAQTSGKRRFSETEQSVTSTAVDTSPDSQSVPLPPAKRPRGRPPKRATMTTSPTAGAPELSRSGSQDSASSPIKSAASKARPSAAVPQKFMAEAVEILGMSAEQIKTHVDFESILSEVVPERYDASYAFGQKIAENRLRQAEAAAKARADKLSTKASLEHERDAAIAQRDEAFQREALLAAGLVAAQAEIQALKQRLGMA